MKSCMDYILEGFSVFLVFWKNVFSHQVLIIHIRVVHAFLTYDSEAHAWAWRLAAVSTEFLFLPIQFHVCGFLHPSLPQA